MEEFYRLHIKEPTREKDETTKCDELKFSCVDNYPLAIAYVPMQRFRDLYDNTSALNRGTLFKELDKPFDGRKFY